MPPRLMASLLHQQQRAEERTALSWPKKGVSKLVVDGEALHAVEVLKTRSQCTFRVVVEDDAAKVR